MCACTLNPFWLSQYFAPDQVKKHHYFGVQEVHFSHLALSLQEVYAMPQCFSLSLLECCHSRLPSAVDSEERIPVL